MRIFHGSYMVIDPPKTDVGRKNLDFGCGFYVTMLSNQASKWALAVAERKGPRASAFLMSMSSKIPNHQICIISQLIADSFLRFFQYKIVEERL